jgi:hypothetical protein
MIATSFILPVAVQTMIGMVDEINLTALVTYECRRFRRKKEGEKSESKTE